MSTSESSSYTTTRTPANIGADMGWKLIPPIHAGAVKFSESSGDGDTDWVRLPFSDISDISIFRQPVWLSVERLYLAAILADDCDCKRQEFSVNHEELSQMGLRNEELKWLLMKNVFEEAEHPLDHHRRESYRTGGARFSSDRMFVITDFGLELVEQNLSAAAIQSNDEPNRGIFAASEQQELKPSWDGERHELRCAGKVVKKFKWRAANQETILAAFEEEGWPAHIDDPLPQQTEIDPKRRLADAIKSLNRHQKFSLVRFCGDGTGEGVLWELK